jgi:hypothetical protein
MLCYGFPSKGPSCTMWFRRFTKYDTMSVANPHSTEQDTQPIAFLISKKAIPYQTCGGTCCLGVSTPKIRSLVDLSTTCHDGINHLHHSNHCSKQSIDPHRVNSHLNGWKTQHSHKDTSQTQHHKGWKDLYDSQDCMAKHI